MMLIIFLDVYRSEKQITESLTWIEAERGPGIRAAHGIPDVVTPAPAAAQ